MIKSIKDWKSFKINESDEKPEKDYTKEYIDKNKMITHESIKSVEDIEKILMASEGELNTFLKSKGINYQVKLQKEGKYFKYRSEEIKTGTGAFGVFEKVIKHAQYNNFGGGSILTSTWKDQFYFSPEIWLGNVNISYEAQVGGGTNGMNVAIAKDYTGYPSSNVWFIILDNKYISADEIKH